MREEIEKREDELRKLGKIIELNAKSNLSMEQRQTIENAEFKLEFSLKNLMDEFRIKELDMRIKSFKEVLETLKNV